MRNLVQSNGKHGDKVIARLSTPKSFKVEEYQATINYRIESDYYSITLENGQKTVVSGSMAYFN